MAEEKSTNYCIVIKSGSGPLALIREGESLRLPVISLPNETWPAEEAAELNGLLMDHHGLNCTMLRWLENWGNTNLLIMEWHPGSPLPEVNVEWMDPGLENLPLPPEQLQMIEKWQKSSAESVVPWENPGWMQSVVMWLFKTFNGTRYPQLTNLAQIKAGWGMSTLLLIETTESDYFFKAGARLGVDEWKLMRLLHSMFPDFVPNPQLVNEQHGWMVNPRIENRPIAALDYEALTNSFRAYAEIQLGCTHLHKSGHAPELIVRDAPWLHSHVDAFFTDDMVPDEFSQLKSQLVSPELARLENIWRQNIKALDTATLPLTLNQEDIHFENILNTENGPVLIDWADCAMAHPFFSFHRINSLWGNDLRENDRLERAHVQKAYLDSFRHLADESQLQREIEITGRLKFLYHAFRWQEVAQKHRSGSYWGRRCRENAVARMKNAVQQAALQG